MVHKILFYLMQKFQLSCGNAELIPACRQPQYILTSATRILVDTEWPHLEGNLRIKSPCRFAGMHIQELNIAQVSNTRARGSSRRELLEVHALA